MKATKTTSWFGRFSKWTARTTGHPATFATALLIILIWGISGPIFGFSTTWQLVINSFTTIVTFLMVFLIQSTQNRDSQAVQIKLDELIRVAKEAHLALLDLEELDEKDLEQIRADYARLADEAREDLRQGKSDTGAPEVNHAPDGK